MQGKRIIYIMLCLLLLLGVLQAFAQEETETPLPPPTEPLATVPSATFTPLPANTASATMTATATETSSPTSTASATMTATTTETSSPTNTLTATNTLVVASETLTTTFTPVASTETLVPIDTATTTFTPVANTETLTATAPAEVTDSVEIATTATVDSNAYAIRGLESNASPSVSQFGDTPSTNQINQTMYYLTDFETTALSPPTVRIDNVSLSNTTLIVAVPSSFPPEYGGFSARTSLPALQTSQLSVTVNLNEAHTIFGINNYNYSFPLIPSAMVQHYYTYNDANGNIITQSSICDDGYNLNNCRPIMPFGVPNVWSITVHLDYIDATHPNPSSTFLDNISFTASVDVTPPTATPISCTASSFAQVQGSAPQSSDGDDSCPNPTETSTASAISTLTPDNYCISTEVVGVNIRDGYYPTANILHVIGSKVPYDPWRLRLVGYVDVPEIGRYYRVEGAYIQGDQNNLDSAVQGWLSKEITSANWLCDSNIQNNNEDINLPLLIVPSNPLVTYGTATYTPSPPPTPTPPPDWSNVLPLPMVNVNPIRLTRCGLHTDGDLVLGIDLNPIGGASQSFPLITPADGIVVTIDTEYAGNNNAGLGNFIAIRVDINELDINILDRLSGNSADGIDYNQAQFDDRYQNIGDVSFGAIYIGYAHLQDNSIPQNLQVGDTVTKGTIIGYSGTTGLTDSSGNPITNGQHLHVATFYHPEISVPNPQGFNISNQNYNWFFWAYDLADNHPNIYGQSILVNPLVLWPSAQQDTSCPYWQILQPSS